ncbi:uncharacterized protein LAJ45_08603 [Morchella importuna]|uniref:uncharacterized protein n=1 Tax=Morchella importuna TaxID=1174673 RepID=UPI001E8D5C4E|nr:uncharacterized protein LAJ45_08603 [Morchella importuna]KAH8147447.1 hypothetical protein LAJ45_08603 [Morchella importuna]
MAPPKDKWDDEAESSEEEVAGTVPRIAPKKKWDDEEDDDDVLDSWDAADDSEEERKKEAERIAERQAEKAAAAERAARELEELENETPAQKRERERRRQEESDMSHAIDLFGAVGIGAGSGIGNREKKISLTDPNDPTKNIDLGSLLIFNPTTKDAFLKLREVLVPLLTANTKKAHYPLFLQEFARQLSKDMPSEQIRKVASGLTTLANEKQKEEKAADKGGKKKTVKKTALAAAGKEMDKFDTTDYRADNTYDDDDFM